MSKGHKDASNAEPVAGNGLLHRRIFLQGALASAGGMTLMAAGPASAQRLDVPEWMRRPGCVWPAPRALLSGSAGTSMPKVPPHCEAVL